MSASEFKDGFEKGFKYRALEFHSARMWQWAQVEQSLEFMDKFKLNALIFHQNDIVEHLVFPQAFFPEELMWKRWPVRMHSIYQNRHYIDKVVREAAARGIGFYVEIKEIWFVDPLLELVPGLRNADGSICAGHPFWWEFLDLKLRELLKAVPDLAGVIVSPGTRESKVSISTNTCTCARCQATDPTDWYANLLGAMHRPLAEHGKSLAVRDFSYSADQQSRMLDAARRVSGDIIISLKNTPHDYYPTFPDNPRIGHTGGLRQWIEYDTWGQFFGLGVYPVSVIEDMQRRMRHALASGAEGIALRTDWEVITDAGAFNSPNILNVLGGAMLACDVDADLDAVYDAWARHGLYSPLREASVMSPLRVPTHPQAARRLRDFMRRAWTVMEQSAYVRGHLFHEDGQYCDTVDRSLDMLVRIHGRDDWEPGASRLLDPTPANLELIFAEKAAATREAAGLIELLRAEDLGLGEAMARDMNDMLRLYEVYARGFELCARAVFLVLRAEARPGDDTVAAARATAQPLVDFGIEVRAMLEGTSYPHYLYWTLDTTRTDTLARDVQRRLELLPRRVGLA
jgi:hypothetical protein